MIDNLDAVLAFINASPYRQMALNHPDAIHRAYIKWLRGEDPDADEEDDAAAEPDDSVITLSGQHRQLGGKLQTGRLAAKLLRHQITPPETYDPLDAEFHFDFDPCPYPRPPGFNGLKAKWGRCNWLNPNYLREDGVDGKGPTAFVRRAIDEQAKGKTSVLLLSVPIAVNLLIEAGAEMRSMGRIRWLNEYGERHPSPPPIACFILRGKEQDRH
jgi:hypothetical protein